MTPEELLAEWEAGESTGMRPRRVQQVRDDIAEVTGLTPPRRIPDIESWLERMKGHVTRKLRDAVGDEEDPPPEDESEDNGE